MLRLIIISIISSMCFIAHAEKITAAGDPWPPFLDPEKANNGIIVEIATAHTACAAWCVVVAPL